MQPSDPNTRFERALEAIDRANAEDPNVIVHGGESRPKELLHAERATHWLRVLEPDASELLQIAIRAHHFRRWALPRAEYPLGRAGYHAWRRELQKRHAAGAAEILGAVGYSSAEAERVGELIRKRGLGRDREAQLFEDALCLVFLEIQLESFAVGHDPEKVVDILARTLPKMSDQAKALAGSLSAAPEMAELIRRAVEQVAAASAG